MTVVDYWEINRYYELVEEWTDMIGVTLSAFMEWLGADGENFNFNHADAAYGRMPRDARRIILEDYVIRHKLMDTFNQWYEKRYVID